MAGKEGFNMHEFDFGEELNEVLEGRANYTSDYAN